MLSSRRRPYEGDTSSTGARHLGYPFSYLIRSLGNSFTDNDPLITCDIDERGLCSDGCRVAVTGESSYCLRVVCLGALTTARV